MRRVEVTEPEDPRWQRWLRDCRRATRELIEAFEADEDVHISNLYKRKSIKEIYFFSKGPPFFGKCAYCEAPIPDFQRGDVEHFRPKQRVTDENDEPVLLTDADGAVRLDADGQSLQHPGYPWLAYDWRNLLPSCTICNQPATIGQRKIGKHCRFPVDGRHAETADEVAQERPFLIDPTSEHPDDDPARHLEVDPWTGIVAAKSPRGEMCKNVFGLNLRDQLVDERKKACDQVRALLTRIIHTPGGDVKALEELQAIQAGKKPYSQAQRAVLASCRPLLESLVET